MQVGELQLEDYEILLFNGGFSLMTKVIKFVMVFKEFIQKRGVYYYKCKI